MIKSVTLVRERALARTLDMLEHLRLQVSMLPTTETDVMAVLEKPQVFDTAVELTNILLEKFGHVNAVGEPRFDKTHRLMNKLIPKPLRGALHPKRIKALDGVQDAP